MPERRSLATLIPIQRQSLSDAVFHQLQAQIVGGDLPAGDPLPSERSLCEALGVNRGSVREAMRRLEQAGLVEVRHGGTSRVLDFRANAGLDLLGQLLVTADGRFDLDVVRSVMEMRSAIAPDAANRAALRRSDAIADGIEAVVAAMSDQAGDLPALQGLAVQFWSQVIDASDNIAYRLAYNSLRETYDRCQNLLTTVLQPEFSALGSYRGIASAIRRRNSKQAESLARELIRLGESAVKHALSEMERLSAKGDPR